MADFFDEMYPGLFGEKKNKPGLMSDMRRAVGQGIQGTGSTLRDIGLPDIGASIEDYGRGVVSRNPSEINSFSDILSKPGTTVREAIGEMVPQVGGALAGGVGGRLVGGALGALVGGPAGAVIGQQIGGSVGVVAPSALQTYGGIRTEQRDQGIDDKGRAVLATVPAVALERLAGAEKFAGTLASKGVSGMTRNAADAGLSLPRYMAKEAGKGFLTEGLLTEVPQTAFERFGAYKDLTSPEAFDEYAVAGIKGGLGGAGFQGGMAAFRPRGFEDKAREADLLGTGNKNPNAPLDYEQVPITPPMGPNRPGYLDMPGMDFESVPPAGPFEGPQRPGYLDMPGIDFESLSVPQARMGEIGALRPGLGLPTQDLVNLNTGVARTPTGNTLDTMTAAINEPSGFYGNDPNQNERPINMGDLYEAKLGLESVPPEQPPLRAQARDAFVKAGGSPGAWTKWVSKNKLADADDTALGEALYNRANDTNITKPEPWIAAHQVFAPPEQTKQTQQVPAPVQPAVTAPVETQQPAATQGQGQTAVPALVPTTPGQVALAPEQRALVQKQLIAGLSKRDQEIATTWMETGSFEAAAAKLSQSNKGKPLSRQAIQQAIFGQRKDGKLALKPNGKPKQVGIVDKLRVRAEQMGLSGDQIRLVLTPSQTLAHDEDRVGLAPDAQMSTLDREAYLKPDGEESSGDNRSAGIVDSVGGSQTETSANAGNALATEWLRKNAPEDFARDAWDENRQEGDPYWKDLTPDQQANALGAARRGEPLAQTIEKISAEARQTVIPREQAERLDAAAEGKADAAYEEARAEWEDARGGDANTPAFEVLSHTQQYNWARMLAEGVPVGRAMKKVLTDVGRFGSEGGTKPVLAENPYTAAELLEDLKKYVRADIPGRKLMVVDSVEDLLNDPDDKVKAVGVAISLKGAYGVASDGRAFLIANRIEKGRGRAKFMHEVGAHLGLENLLPKALYNRLVGQIKKWRDSDADTDEVTLANRAMLRVMEANTAAGDVDAELLAYFLEEAVQAGIDPTADVIRGSSELRQWFRTLWAAFKVAVRKLGFNPDKLTAQDVVDLAFGAARLEMAGTWHGTAAKFRNFRHKYMGTGEGAQAYGWGAYLAQAPDVGRGYWLSDIQRKGMDSADNGPVVKPEGLSQVEEALYDRIVNQFGNDTRLSLARYVWNTAPKELKHDPTSLKRVQDLFEKILTVNPLPMPEGSLMRVDTAVADDELLDWDKPLSEQSDKVKAILKQAKRDDGQNLIESLGLDLDDTGADLYQRLVRPRHLGSKKAASEYLDSLGVRGVKYLDDQSRKPAVDLTPLRQEVERWKAAVTEAKAKYEADRSTGSYVKLSSAQWKFGMAEEDLKDAQEQNRAPRTRNLVIFNEKNIFRVGREVAADRQRMRFGVESSAAASPALKKLNDTHRVAVEGNLRHWANRALEGIVFSSDLAKIAVKRGLTKADAFFDTLNSKVAERLKLEKSVERILIAAQKLKDYATVEKFIRDSTAQDKWGFEPDWDKDAKTDPVFVSRFNGLSKEGQQVVKDVFRHGDNTYARVKELVNKEYKDEYDRQLAAATTDAERKQAKKDYDAKMRVMGTKLPKLAGPYAPFGRFGDFVSVAKTAAYKDAEARNDKKEMQELIDQGGHYIVQFHETQGAADASAAELEKTFGERNVDSFPKLKLYKTIDELPWAAIAKVKSAIDELPDSTNKGALSRIVTDIYLQRLAEGSARKSELKRRGVEGADDMFRSFASHGRATAHFIASMMKNQEINDQISQMAKEAQEGDSGTRKDRSRVFNEILARYQQTLDYRPTPIADKLTAVTSFWTLLTSPAYFFQNFTQPFMMSLPMLEGRFGAAKSWGALIRAYKLVGPATKDGWTVEDLKVSDDIKKMLQDMLDTGRIDITIEQDLGKFVEGDTLLGSKKVGTVVRGVEWARGLAGKLESVNRLTTAIAAFELSGGDIKYVKRVLDDTHGNYASSNAPRFFNSGIGKVALQFRKFQLIQASLLVKLGREAIKGESATDRAVARKSLAYMLGHTMVMAGAKGLPAMTGIGWVLAAIFGDDDEPKDWERMLRESIGDEGLADLLIQGFPAAMGVDLSGKLGMTNTFSVMPFVDINLQERGGFEKTVTGLMGPSVGLAHRFWDGAQYLAKGDVHKGWEAMLPSGFQNASKAARFASEGVTNRQGDRLLKPDEIDLVDAVGQALGLPTMTLTGRQRREGDKIEMQQYYDGRTSKIRFQYAKAYREGDAETLTELRQEWGEVQAAMQRNGFKPKPLSNLLKAPQEQAKRERQTVEGVQFNRSTRRFVEEGATQ